MIVDPIRKEGFYERVSKELINLSKEGDIKDLHNDIKYHSKYHIKYKYYITLKYHIKCTRWVTLHFYFQTMHFLPPKDHRVH